MVLLVITFADAGAVVGQTTAPTKATAAGDEAFKDNGDGTVMDENTKFIWQKDDDGRQRNWDDSLKSCRSLSLGGHSDWRLPALNELISLWKDAGSRGEIRKSYFPKMKSSDELYPGAIAPYWSSTAGGSSVLPGITPDNAAWVSFNDGSVHIGTKNFFSFYSRCVRLAK